LEDGTEENCDYKTIIKTKNPAYNVIQKKGGMFCPKCEKWIRLEPEPSRGQMKYIRDLCEELGLNGDSETVGIQTRKQASKKIDELKILKTNKKEVYETI
jgi:hypothetical protein